MGIIGKKIIIFSIDGNFGHPGNRLHYPTLFHYIRAVVFCDDPTGRAEKRSSLHQSIQKMVSLKPQLR
jgi:hypothetical protein